MKVLITKRDPQAFLTLSWEGGTSIRAHSDTGLLVSSWRIPAGIDFADVERNMDWHIAKGDYPLVPF